MWDSLIYNQMAEALYSIRSIVPRSADYLLFMTAMSLVTEEHVY